CNMGTCNPGTGICQAIPANQNGPCTDSNPCTLSDHCNIGVCVGTPRDCSSLTNQCNVGTCNLASGTCQKIPANQGGSCSDGYPCTINDVCFNGLCDGISTQSEVVNLTFTPTTQTVRIGDTVQVTLVATSGTCFPQDVGSIQSILGWDETKLALVGRVDTGPYPWVFSGFPNDSGLDGLNDPFVKSPGNDGDALYLALASFVDGAEVPPPTGLVVTTFVFNALAVASGTQVVIPPTAGSFTASEILGQGSNIEITGSLGSASITIVQCTSSADCNDGNVCTTDSCNVAGNCVHASNTLPCNDGQFCTLSDLCSGGVCVGAGDRCPGQFCNETTDACVQCLVNSHCDDANLCTTDTCNSGICVHANNSLPCDDGLFCTPTDICISGFCTGTGANCSGQFCNEATDSCVECINNGNCNDGNLCTTDTCNASNACVHTNNSSLCNDNLFCTPTDVCSGGACVGSGTTCAVNQFCNESIDSCVQCLINSHCSDGNLCTDDLCLGGVCANPSNSNSCDDGLFCTVGDACSGGACFGGVTIPCPGQLCDEAGNICVDCFLNFDCIDGLSCTTETCVDGACIYNANHAACNDGLFCTGAETCQLGFGCVSSGNPCDGLALCDEPGDFCRCPSPTIAAVGSRHIQITPQAGATPVAFRVDSADVDLFCLPKYADTDGTLSNIPVFQTPAAWGTFSVSDTYIEPASSYTVEADCRRQPTTDPQNLSPAVSVNTTNWADMDGSGVVDVDDLIILLVAFATNTAGAPDLLPCATNDLVDVDDLVGFLGAFAGEPYPCPAPCP
ncbi:MAG: hypothetical protein AABZ47_09525, partial [Planctomycetota bacterium]